MIKKILGVTFGIVLFLVLPTFIFAQINIISPISQEYNSKSVLLNFNSDVKGDFYLTRFYDSTDGIILCRNAVSCRKIIRANEGENHFWVKRIADKETSFSNEIEFFVDSTAPKIFKTNFAYDSRGYLGLKGVSVSYSEANLKKAVLFYENEAGTIKRYLENTNCPSGERQVCTFLDVDLSGLEGQKVEFSVRLIDSVLNNVTSRKQRVIIDSTAPEITSAEYSVKGGTRVSFTIGVSEKNLKEIRYKDVSECYSSGYREGILCTKTNKNGKCVSDRTLCSGFHKITITAKDYAGNEDTYEFSEIKIDN